MINLIIKKLFFVKACIIFSIFDIFLWILIKLLPKTSLLNLIKKRYFQTFKIKINNAKRKKIKNLFLKVIDNRCNTARWASSCLSRSIAGRLFLDLIKEENVIFLGVVKNENNNLIAHAWLKDVSTSKNITPGIKNQKGVTLNNY